MTNGDKFRAKIAQMSDKELAAYWQLHARCIQDCPMFNKCLSSELKGKDCKDLMEIYFGGEAKDEQE